MENVRTYGKAPFGVAVVHGGPGGAGEMAPVARELSHQWGVLEPLQTALSLEGQVAELRSALLEHATCPVALIGFSWGAWLSVILAARFPELVNQLILVGSGPFLEADAAGIDAERMGRLTPEERAEVKGLLPDLKHPSARVRNEVFLRFGRIFSKADAFDPMEGDKADIFCSADIFNAVWPEAAQCRRNGSLLTAASSLTCPVTAIHGDYDPHPADGVRVPLEKALDEFQFFLLPQCGHVPWKETQARAPFYDLLKKSLRRPCRK
ncbi:alpha/beta fold hydrolase [Desulfoluna butyratoxydans]|uniref:Alpha/beta hydrolase fold n=1 Tax=Desulfoluna butyratoxydans TaxID=231438 RepID=A0A4U8YR35_9BACT|nr:alpha/beta hydrolase [Desulfoluna butyratoxydans]VFQ46746.1 alpha/beta hydrolase fold [Desulfoluna butyratoxydans]